MPQPVTLKKLKLNRSIQSAKTRWGVDCGSDHELLIARFRLKLKKVGKTPRPFRYDVNKIPYDYTVDAENGLVDTVGEKRVGQTGKAASACIH